MYMHNSDTETELCNHFSGIHLQRDIKNDIKPSSINIHKNWPFKVSFPNTKVSDHWKAAVAHI